MRTRRSRCLAALSVAAFVPLALSAGASADEIPHHDGPPQVWGPPLAAYCANPALAVAAGYNLIFGGPGNDNDANDYLDGGTQWDGCNGGAGLNDVAVQCEGVTQVP